MEPEDISGILEVDRKISGKVRVITYRDLVREALGDQIDMSFVAEMDNQFVGFVMASLAYVREQVSEACVIQIFGVDPQYQWQGIATQLIQALLDKTRSKGIKLVRVMVEERDGELQGFFKRLGFDRGRHIDFLKTVWKTFLSTKNREEGISFHVKFGIWIFWTSSLAGDPSCRPVAWEFRILPYARIPLSILSMSMSAGLMMFTKLMVFAKLTMVTIIRISIVIIGIRIVIITIIIPRTTREHEPDQYGYSLPNDLSFIR
jgi:predicted N-acetyltransferase YhbS